MGTGSDFQYSPSCMRLTFGTTYADHLEVFIALDSVQRLRLLLGLVRHASTILPRKIGSEQWKACQFQKGQPYTRFSCEKASVHAPWKSDSRSTFRENFVFNPESIQTSQNSSHGMQRTERLTLKNVLPLALRVRILLRQWATDLTGPTHFKMNFGIVERIVDLETVDVSISVRIL